MRQACYRGRTGEIEDREPIPNAEKALRCPSEARGHLDRLHRLSEETRPSVFDEAERRRTKRRGSLIAA